MRRRPLLTLFLITVNVTVFFTGLFYGIHGQLLSQFGFSLGAAFDRPIVLLTAAFLHSDLAHLVYNMLFLAVFGAACEEEIGTVRTGILYLAGILGGALFFSLLFPTAQAVGASGAIFALLAAAVLIAPGRPVLERVPYPIGLLGVVYLLPAAANAFSLADNVANIAHVGGAIAGAVLAFHWEPQESKRGLVAVVGFALLILGMGLL